jgi:hypothetical protein
VDDRAPDRQDLDTLLDFLLKFAQQTLERYGEFYPFGAVLTNDGDVVGQAGQLVETDRPPSQAIIDLITAGMKAQADDGAIRASGLCYDVKWRMPDDTITDAIFVALEHRSGRTVAVAQPYSKGRFRGFRYGDLMAQAGEPQVFTGSASTPPA